MQWNIGDIALTTLEIDTMLKWPGNGVEMDLFLIERTRSNDWTLVPLIPFVLVKLLKVLFISWAWNEITVYHYLHLFTLCQSCFIGIRFWLSLLKLGKSFISWLAVWCGHFKRRIQWGRVGAFSCLERQVSFKDHQGSIFQKWLFFGGLKIYDDLCEFFIFMDRHWNRYIDVMKVVAVWVLRCLDIKC